MKVLHIITTFERGGAEKSVLQLAHDQVNLGMDVEIIYLKGKPELVNHALEYGIRISESFSSHSFLWQIFALQKRKKPIEASSTLVHVHLSRAELLARLVFGRSPFVVTRHNAETLWNKVPNPLSSALSRLVTKYADIVAISESVRQFLYNNKEIAEDKSVQVIYYSYKELGKTLVSNERNRAKVDESRIIKIGTVSRLARQKGLDILINAAFMLNGAGFKIHLYILGDGPEKKNLKRLVESLKLEKCVTFLSRMDEPRFFIRNLDIFVLSSRYEGLGRVLLEAMEMQVPIVATRISAIPEILGSQHPGLFYPLSATALAEKIKSFLVEKDLVQMACGVQNKRIRFFINYEPALKYAMIYGELLSLRAHP